MIGKIYLTGNTDSTPEIVTFQDGTDEQIAKMLDAHYKGKINIEDYWSVGDARQVQLNAMSSGTGADETHVKQLMTMVIIGLNHDDLKEQAGSRTKAAVTIQCREILGNKGTVEDGYYWGSIVQDENVKLDTNYSQSPRRIWLNGTFINSMPSTFNTLIKTVVKKNLNSHVTTTDWSTTEDKAFLLSYPEVFGNASEKFYYGNQKLEGNQYPYYKIALNQTKYINNNGEKYTDTQTIGGG